MSGPARPWIVGGLLTALAVALTAVTPAGSVFDDPVDTRGTVGTPIVGRTSIVTVDQVRFSDAIDTRDGAISGNWIIVDVTAQARHDVQQNPFPFSRVIADGRTYIVTDRVSGQFTSTSVQPGLPMTGMLAFRIADDITSGTVLLEIPGDLSNPVRDTLMQVPIVLDDLDHESLVEIEKPEWAG